MVPWSIFVLSQFVILSTCEREKIPLSVTDPRAVSEAEVSLTILTFSSLLIALLLFKVCTERASKAFR